MKRSVEVLALAVAGLLGAAGAQAASPVVRITADASLQKPLGSSLPASVLHVATTFSTDTPGADLFTVQRVVLYFPDRGTDGAPFPSCSARQIARLHGNIRRCPRGSEVGSGVVKARVLGLGITARGQVALFNSHHGTSITFNIQTNHPAAIDRSFDAPIRWLHGGRYGATLTLEVPPPLQEILPGVFVAVQQFDVTIDGAIRVHGVQRNYVEARTCPPRPMRGVFDFEDSATGRTASVTTDAKLSCTVS